MEMKKALLVVSFGTSYKETRAVTIEASEKALREAFPDRTFYRAWTSPRIVAKLKRTEGISIDNVAEACARMKDDGMEDILIQPTHILNGIEYDLLTADVNAARKDFVSVSLGKPLLTSHEDTGIVLEALRKIFSFISPDEALVFVGHGTPHYANTIYAALEYAFRDMGCPNFHMGTVSAYPDIEAVKRRLAERKPRKVWLTPFLLVAGEHALHDIAGEEAASWASALRAAGYETECLLKGLGEYPEIRKLFVEHAGAALDKTE